MIFFRMNKDGSGFTNITFLVVSMVVTWVLTIMFAATLVALVLSCE